MLPPQPPSPATLAPGVQRIIAPNPSPMTYWGTNTYVIGQSDVAVIDPGPAHDGHLDAIIAAMPLGGHVVAILVTHAHLDHSPGAHALAKRVSAPVYSYGPWNAGRSHVMQDLAAQGMSGGGEGVDRDFAPDSLLKDGAEICGSDWALKAIHTPGHMGNHHAYALDDTLFCGDLVMGWSSSLVSPPDGDLTDFMASCRRLLEQPWSRFFPGHGDPIDDPLERLNWLITHRERREAQILNALIDGASTAERLARKIYIDTPVALLPAAERNVFAHLVDLTGRNLVAPQGVLSTRSFFVRTA
ncbi:MAG: MBL fold metallo-hydrolase [Marinovum sp.]|nr:MBL fold metallo-hydrolase [Marinovum sp.]